jgi:hypothetical protein
MNCKQKATGYRRLSTKSSRVPRSISITLNWANAVGSHPSWKATDTIIKERLDAALMQFDQWESKRKRLIASATV